MDFRVNDIESAILGRSVLELSNPSETDDLIAIERRYRANHDPLYVLCKVPVEQLAVVHRLEDAGFRFIETQLRLTFTLKKPFEVPESRYRFERVADDAALRDVLAIARTSFPDERWLNDPAFAGRPDLVGRRYEAYVAQSYRRPDEHVHRLVDTGTGETVALKTHRLVGSGEALMLLGAVPERYRESGIAPLAAYCEYNELLGEGVHTVVTHVSARNYPILNFEIRRLRYRVLQAFVVLRKTYES